MYSIDIEAFHNLVSEAIDAIPPKFGENLKNVAFVVEEEPNEEQQRKLQLSAGQSLFGLYEGIPLVNRGGNYSMVLPDKITLFKRPLEFSANTMEELCANIHKTVWHEVAHYYGLGHDKIHELESKQTEK